MESIKRDLVTVIVPVFNTGTIVNRCVDSLIQQTYKEIEIIMIDDGSTDITSKILDQWSLSDNRIRIIHQKNTGVSGARNRGLKEANGKWIIFVDADDYVALDYVELMLQHMNNFTLPICDYFEVNENEKKVAMNLPSEWKNEKITLHK